ncbi:hypothetical protein HGI30_04105 [Paenibacillus albicereus]|uniref:Uncharacterized protein n=1 Tax=Paenibacillus albicereus TaxID=2726185 RepID=A0A6H2GTV1_9BACL|nr:hypothetical protein [Paenibacillus albicereus]QJC50827.1 hypothetical protein HGI30_04105 [Paenibacillus albicereus]
MYEIGQKYRHLITKEVVQIYFVYRHARTKQETKLDLVSAMTDSSPPTAADASLADTGGGGALELHRRLRALKRQDVRVWHMPVDKFRCYYDRA